MNRFLFLIFIVITTISSANAQNSSVNMTDKEKEDLFTAAGKGDLDAVKKAKAAGADLTITNTYGTTLLMATASSGNNELVKYLLTAGVDVKAKNENGETALHYAASKGNLEMVKMFVEAGADVNAINLYYGKAVLNYAVVSDNLETVKYLVNKGANVNNQNVLTPLSDAAFGGYFEIFKYIADRSKNVDWQEYLFYAIKGGNLDLIKYVVEVKGANPNVRSKNSETIIECAAERKYKFNQKNSDVQIIKYLLSKGAKLGDINGGKIFPWAMEKCSEEVIAFFIESGVKVDANMTDKYDWPLLPAALDNNNFSIAQKLLTDKNPEFRGMPLVVFFSDGLENSYDVVSFLIKNGINKDSYSRAFLKSIECGDLKTAQLLLASGANINTKNEKEYNALFFTDDYETAKFLISKGIKTNDTRLPEHIFKFTRFNLLSALFDSKIKIPASAEQLGEGLVYMAQIGNARAVKTFLSMGADINYKSLYIPNQNYLDSYNYRTDRTALIMTAIQGYASPSYIENAQVSTETTEVLIKAGADLNAKDQCGRTALHYTAEKQRFHVYPSSNIVGTSRRERETGGHGYPSPPPAQNHHDIAKVLIKAGASLNEKDAYGNTPLHLSANAGNYEALKILLEAGAKTDIKNNEEKTFFDYLDNEGLNILKEIKPSYSSTVMTRISELSATKVSKNKQYEIICDAGVEDLVDIKPSFYGGERALMKWISENIDYPIVAQEYGIQGKVFVNFIVRRDGSITNVKVIKGVHISLDKEAERLVKEMPRWKPGEKGGQIVSSRFTLPVTFILK